MKCDTCQNESRFIKVVDGVEHCPNCAGFSEAGGTRVDGVITRGSFRVRSENIKFEKDFILPHKYDKASKKIVENPDFAKAYPNKAKELFKKDKKK